MSDSSTNGLLDAIWQEVLGDAAASFNWLKEFLLGEFVPDRPFSVIVAEMLAMDEPRRRFGAMIAGLDIRYDLGEGHPLLGRRMPDLDIVTEAGPTRVYALLHDGRPVLLDLGLAATIDGGRVKRVEATFDGVCELPVVGAVTLPAAMLIRPDGYVAWAGVGGADGLRAACAAWFGA